MKVIAINGSPRAKGNTYTSLAAVCEELNKNGIETEIIQIGNMNLTGYVLEVTVEMEKLYFDKWLVSNDK